MQTEFTQDTTYVQHELLVISVGGGELAEMQQAVVLEKAALVFGHRQVAKDGAHLGDV